MQSLLTDRELAEWIGIPVHTIRAWRSKGLGPPYVNFGKERCGLVRYRQVDVQEWVDDQVVNRGKESLAGVPPSPR